MRRRAGLFLVYAILVLALALLSGETWLLVALVPFLVALPRTLRQYLHPDSPSLPGPQDPVGRVLAGPALAVVPGESKAERLVRVQDLIDLVEGPRRGTGLMARAGRMAGPILTTVWGGVAVLAAATHQGLGLTSFFAGISSVFGAVWWMGHRGNSRRALAAAMLQDERRQLLESADEDGRQTFPPR